MRAITGSRQVVVIGRFADLAAMEAWYYHENMRRARDEQQALLVDSTIEIWGSTLMMPAPARAWRITGA